MTAALEMTAALGADAGRARDEQEIRALLDRYTDAVNHRDYDTVRACWAEDGVWELHAPINGRYEGADAILAECRRAVDSQELFVQMTHAIVVTDLTDRTARARVTLNEVGKARQGVPGALPGVGGMNILAFYTDELVKRDGAWRFRKRVYDVVLIDFAAPQGQVQPAPAF
jgi:hypothetical protein